MKINDVNYIKHEKLLILEKLCTEKNFEIILNELKEYTYDTDLNFAQKAIKIIGNICILYSESYKM